VIELKKTIKDIDIDNKKVIIRVDYNVPIQDNKIMDDNRIKMSLKTINYALNHNCKVILMSHLGRIKSESDKKNNSLEIVAKRLSELVDVPVHFVDEVRGKKLEDCINNMDSKEIVLMENTRFLDYPEKLESSNDLELARYWSSLGEVFINDAFATSHRSHASNVGIASNLESGIGFLVEEELNNINSILDNSKHPFVVVMGGSKVSDKIGLIENILPKCDFMLIGGAMVFTFIKAIGNSIGLSLLDSDNIDYCKGLMDKYKDKIIIPDKVIVNTAVDDSNIRECGIDDIKENEIGLDIVLSDKMKSLLLSSKQVIWNGPVGMFEKDVYEGGTRKICELLNNSQVSVFVGGGDTGSAVKKFGYGDNFYISTGGGASLTLLEGNDLPGVSVVGEV